MGRRLKITPRNQCNLTPKEFEIVPWIALGKTNHDISRILGCSEQTIANQISSILSKMDASNRAHIVAKAVFNGIISIQVLIMALIVNGSDIDMRRGARRQSRRRIVMSTSYSIKVVNLYYIPDKKT